MAQKINSTYVFKKVLEKLLPRPMVIHQLKLLYYPTAKIASTSIREYLIRCLSEANHTDNSTQLLNLDSFAPLRVNMYRARKYVKLGYHSFAVTREPVARLVSCFKDKILPYHGGQQVYSGFARYNTILGKQLFHPNMTFDEFVSLVGKIPDFLAEAHFRSQHRALPVIGNKVRIDYLHRLESLDDSMAQMCSELGLPAWQPVKSNTTAGRSTIHPSKKDLAIIHKRYRRDLILLGYQQNNVS